jgi:DNA invertase Pin-like site-specific DNA recombinase
MSKAIGYIRVSTTDQDLGLEDQRRKIIKFCNEKELELVDILEDNGVSGGLPIEDRENGKKLCEIIRDKKSQVKEVVMLKLDRGFRDTEDCLHHAREWVRLGVKINFLDLSGMDLATGEGLLQLTLMAGFATYERGRIRKRTLDALAVKRSKGEKLGGRLPYGFNWELNSEGTKILVPNKKEQEVIGLIKKMKSMGMSPEKIAVKMNEAGVKPKDAGMTIKTKTGPRTFGNQWHFRQIYRILNREEQKWEK